MRHSVSCTPFLRSLVSRGQASVPPRKIKAPKGGRTCVCVRPVPSRVQCLPALLPAPS